MPFQKGQSGNLTGKPKGVRNKISVEIERLLAGSAEEVTQKLVEKALEGDLTAIKLVIDRLSPARRDQPITLEMPHLTSAEDASRAIAEITAAVARGELTPEEGVAVAKLIESFARICEKVDLETRVQILEERLANGK